MPAPKMGSLTMEQMPVPRSEKEYFVREILSESGNTGASTHLRMSTGFFAKIPVNDKFSVMQYVGIGFLKRVASGIFGLH